MLVSYHTTTWCHNPEDHDMNLLHYENLKSHTTHFITSVYFTSLPISCRIYNIFNRENHFHVFVIVFHVKEQTSQAQKLWIEEACGQHADISEIQLFICMNVHYLF